MKLLTLAQKLLESRWSVFALPPFAACLSSSLMIALVPAGAAPARVPVVVSPPEASVFAPPPRSEPQPRKEALRHVAPSQASPVPRAVAPELTPLDAAEVPATTEDEAPAPSSTAQIARSPAPDSTAVHLESNLPPAAATALPTGAPAPSGTAPLHESDAPSVDAPELEPAN
jgi:hypothetical protein